MKFKIGNIVKTQVNKHWSLDEYLYYVKGHDIALGIIYIQPLNKNCLFSAYIWELHEVQLYRSMIDFSKITL